MQECSFTYSLSNKISRGVMQKGLKYSHQGIFILSEKAECDLTSSPKGTYTTLNQHCRKSNGISKHTIISVSAEGIDHVMCQPERHYFGLLKCLTFVEETIEVNM